MKKRRILSMLLAVAIGCSCMSIAASAEEISAADTESNVYALDDGWVVGNTAATLMTDVEGDGEKTVSGDNEYIHINNDAPTNTSSASKLAGGAYTDNVTLKEGKTYRFTVWLRNAPTYIDGELNENTYSVFLGYDLSANPIFKVGENRDIEVLAVDGEGIDKTTGKVTLGDTWTKYTSIFTVTKDVPFKHPDVNGGIIFYPTDRTACDGTPFDIDGFSLYEAELTAENGYLPKSGTPNLVSMSTSKWSDRDNWFSKDATRTFKYESPYFSVDAGAEIKYAPDDNAVIEPGIYELTGDFRLGEIFYDEWIDSPAGGNEANLTAEIGGVADSTATELSVTNDWTSAKFIFDIRNNDVKLDDIKFILDEARVLDIRNVKLTRTAAYSTEWIHQNGGYVMKISEAVDFDNYIVAISQKDNSKYLKSAFGYKSDALTNAMNAKTGTYELSFWVRADARSDGSFDEIPVTLGTEFSSEFVLSKLGKTGDDAIGHINVTSIEGATNSQKGYLAVSDKWQKYTINFTLDGGLRNISARGIRFHAVSEMLEIGGLKLVRTDTNTEIIDDGNVSLANWYTDTLYCSRAAFEKKDLVADYFTAEAVAGKDTVVRSGLNETIPMGVYEVSGQFRADSDAKLTLSNGAQIAGTVDISTSWSNCSFELKLRKETEMSEIVFSLDGSYEFDFADVEFKKISDYTDDYVYLNGDAVAVIKEPAEFVNYITATSQKDGFDKNSGKLQNAAFGYCDDALTAAMDAKTGTYELSFWMRGNPNFDGDFDKIVVTLGSEYSSEFVLSKLGKTGDDGIGHINVTSIDGNVANTTALAPAAEWQKYTVKFELDGGLRNIAARGIRFHAVSEALEIGGLKLVRTDTDETVIDDKNAHITKWYTDNVYCSKTKFEVSTFIADYYRAEAVDGVNTGIRASSAATLSMGVYEVSGKFRAGADTTLTVSREGENTVSTSLSADWQNIKLELKLKKDVSLSEIIFELDGSYELDFADITFEKISDYTKDYIYIDGEPVVKIADKYEFVNYITATSQKDGFDKNSGKLQNAAFGYCDDALTAAMDAKTGTYELSFWLRGTANENGNFDKIIATLGTEFSSEHILTKLGTTGSDGFGEINVTSIDGETDLNGKLLVSDEWQKYTVKFEIIGEMRNISTYGIRFHAVSNALEVGGLKLVRTDTGDTVIDESNADITKWYTDNVYCSKASLETKAVVENYYRAEATSGINTAITFGSDDILPMGVYKFSGKFRTDSGSAVILTASANGAANEPIEISDNWTDGVLTVRLKSATPLSQIIFALDGEYGLDFTAITYEKDADYISDWTSTDGSPVVDVVEDIEFPSYIHAVGNDDTTNPNFGFGYRSDALTEAISTGEGTYELSVWLREFPGSDYTGDLDRVVITLGSQFSSEYVLNKVGTDSTGALSVNAIDGDTVFNQYGSQFLAPTTEWQKYTINFTLHGTVRDISGIGIRFHNMKLPIDVGALSLVRLDTNEVLIDDSTVESEKWYTDRQYIDTANFEIREALAHYYRAEGTAGQNTSVTPSSADTLEAGLYYVTGKFRVGPDSEASANLCAFIGEAAIKTLSGNTGEPLSNIWTEVTFVIDTAVDGIGVGGLKFMLDSDINLEFVDISIEQIEHYVSISDINIGTVMTLLILKKAHEEGRAPLRDYGGERVEIPLEKMPVTKIEGNVITNDLLVRSKNWIYGEQTVSFAYSDDGSVCVSARDITDNKTGFTFAPNVALRSGVYRFSGEFRTANPGETTVIRIYVGGKMLLFTITNEWTPVEVMFETNEKTAIEFTVKGGPVAWYTQDFDMRKISLVDMASEPIDIAVTKDGDFEGASSLNNWAPGTGAGNIDRVTEDGNTFMRNTKRTLNYTGIYYTLPEGVIMGVAYKISYDIRTSNPGETMIARAHYYEGDNKENVDLTIAEGASNKNGNEFEITNEWRHVESSFVATLTGKFRFGIAGGQSATEDIKNFDIDNFTITRLSYGAHLDEYNAGDFEDPLTATARWSSANGAGTFTRVVENGNAFLRNEGRTVNYQNLSLATSIPAKPGNTVRVAYDVRTAVPGETSILRANIRIGGSSGIIDLPLVSGATRPGGESYEVTNEWKHVESVYTVRHEGNILFGICGGPRVEYIQAFDIDNLVIEVIG